MSTRQANSTLADLPLETEYRSDCHDLVRDFYLPCLQRSTQYRRAVGYFTSRGLSVAAQGITALIQAAALSVGDIGLGQADSGVGFRKMPGQVLAIRNFNPGPSVPVSTECRQDIKIMIAPRPAEFLERPQEAAHPAADARGSGDRRAAAEAPPRDPA